MEKYSRKQRPYGRRHQFFGFLLIAVAVGGLSAAEAEISSSAELRSRKSGSYQLRVTSPLFEVTNIVEMEFFIPKSLKADELSHAPLIVFYHGNTSDKTYFRKRNIDMKKKAEKYKFILLCPQQWWSLAKGNMSGNMDSGHAVNYALHQLKDAQLFDPNQVYVVGFSAGGLTAFLTVMNGLNHHADPAYAKHIQQFWEENFRNEGKKLPANFDAHAYSYRGNGSIVFNEYPYRGFASFKGNYYAGAMGFPADIEDLPAHFRTIFSDNLAFVSVGGKKDAARIQTQAPEMRNFLKDYLGLDIVYKEYPAEGHSLTQQNWDDFYSEVKKRAGK